MNIAGRYILGLLATLMVLSSCRNNYEWININPEKIQKARKYVPQSEKVNQVDITIDLKEKDKTVYYSEPTGFFADQEKSSLANSPTAEKKKTKSTLKKRSFLASSNSVVSTSNKIEKKQSNKPLIVSKSATATKLNGALKLPSKPLSKSKEALKSVNGNLKPISKTASEIRSLAFNDIKSKNPEIESKSNQNIKRGQSLLWVGLVLGIAGLALGFIFGRSAFIISIVGVVFAAIGFFIQR
ncbi:hypothetical protein A5893_14175 [Pedobacter psychrophilus]|uniref:Uncharacterized protein n=1 Tax=Pedobacter psychrophilus TaxID=1826909 RepID=A0A179DDG2_9SPHI|nr:hypothetical protein [Pedobacter psychrophilus]OAQ38559.1 hypothetical protein A5893_14175 [Pedobacter psychrophilus]